MEKQPRDVGFHLGEVWVTPDTSRIIRFESDPLCDHLEVDTDGDCPMAYIVEESVYMTLEKEGWSVWTYTEASTHMKEFMISLQSDYLTLELLQWYTQNP